MSREPTGNSGSKPIGKANGKPERNPDALHRSGHAAAAPRLPLDEPPLRPSFRRERAAIKRGVFPVAGCDEVGRGPLAGPVVAAAVVLDPRRIPRGLDDSKKLEPATRERLYERICATAQVGIAFGSRARIDRDNIRQASLWALARAVAALPVRPRLVLVDGIDRIDTGCDCEAIVSGDALVLSIAAASIVAKVVRDRLMVRVGAAHPGYGFERHMGYSVPEHFRALTLLGPTVHHRRSFAPVAAAYGNGGERAVGSLCRDCVGEDIEYVPMRFDTHLGSAHPRGSGDPEPRTQDSEQAAPGFPLPRE